RRRVETVISATQTSGRSAAGRPEARAEQESADSGPSQPLPGDPAGDAAGPPAPRPDVATSPIPRTPFQVFLGLFVCCQIFFLVTTNIFGFLRNLRVVAGQTAAVDVIEQIAEGENRDKERLGAHTGHLYELHRVFKRWEQVTNQDQFWRLFAPGVADHFGLP